MNSHQDDTNPKNTPRAIKLVTSVVDTFVTELLEVAEGLGGNISSEQIKNIAKGYADSPEGNDLIEVCKAILQKPDDSTEPALKRARPLERILVGRVEGLFPSRGELGKGRQILSRRGLPGLFHIIETLIGVDFFQEQSAICEKVLADFKTSNSNKVDWSKLHKNSECNNAVDMVLGLFAIHIEKMENRNNWIIEQINVRLADAEEYAYEGDLVSTWEIDNSSVQILLRGLYAHFLLKFAEPMGREDLGLQFGEESMVAVEKLLSSLRGAA